MGNASGRTHFPLFVASTKHEKGGREMVQPIVHDTFFLRQKSEPATKADKQI